MAVSFQLPAAVEEGLRGRLSGRSRTLLEAFPAEADGRRVAVDVRNRQWAAMVVEILRAAGEGGRGAA